MIMGIDPGRNKVGLAILENEDEVIYKDIVKTSNLSGVLANLIKEYQISKYIVGNGTYSDKIYNILDLLVDRKKIIFIDEENTTYMAEERYRNENPPLGLKWLNKVVKFKPKKAVDDYVAVILVENYFKKTP